MENKKPRSIALPLILIVVLGVGSFLIRIAFEDPSIPDGGDCSYSSVYHPALIIGIDTVSEGYCEMEIEVRTDYGTDTLLYSQVFGGYASFEQIRRHGLSLGDTLQYQIRDITSGSCDPHIETLLLPPAP